MGYGLLTGFCSCRSRGVTPPAQAQVRAGAGTPWAAVTVLSAVGVGGWGPCRDVESDRTATNVLFDLRHVPGLSF